MQVHDVVRRQFCGPEYAVEQREHGITRLPPQHQAPCAAGRQRPGRPAQRQTDRRRQRANRQQHGSGRAKREHDIGQLQPDCGAEQQSGKQVTQTGRSARRQKQDETGDDGQRGDDVGEARAHLRQRHRTERRDQDRSCERADRGPVWQQDAGQPINQRKIEAMNSAND